jgi:hypothetical protein
VPAEYFATDHHRELAIVRAGADAYVTTCSGSALLSTEPEFELDAFWHLVGSLKMKIDHVAGASYVIVTRDDDMAHNELPALGFHTVGSGDTRRRYHDEIRTQVRKSGWKYSVYAVGAAALQRGAKPAASAQFAGLSGRPQELHALR